MRGFGSENIDHRLRQSDFRFDKSENGIPWLGTSIADISSLNAVLIVGSTLRKDHPLIAQRMRQAVKKGLQLNLINPISDDTASYLQLLIGTIEQEFEHNLAQQLYVSADSWKAILSAKLAIVAKLRSVAENSDTPNDLRENVLIDYSQNENPVQVAVSFLKQEVKKLI